MKLDFSHGYETTILLGLLLALILLKYCEETHYFKPVLKLLISFMAGALISFSTKLKLLL